VELVSSIGVVGSLDEISVGYGPDRPWHELWYSVRQRLAAIEEGCRRKSYQGNDDVRRAFNDFFVACDSMVEHLKGDPASKAHWQDARQLRKSNQELKIASGLAILAKHHSRDDQTAMAALISGIRSNKTGIHVTVAWTEKGSGNT
jgi:hypothetical protein